MVWEQLQKSKKCFFQLQVINEWDFVLTYGRLTVLASVHISIIHLHVWRWQSYRYRSIIWRSILEVSTHRLIYVIKRIMRILFWLLPEKPLHVRNNSIDKRLSASVGQHLPVISHSISRGKWGFCAIVSAISWLYIETIPWLLFFTASNWQKSFFCLFSMFNVLGNDRTLIHNEFWTLKCF